MAKRGKSARAQVPLRIPEAQRARLEKAAKARGVSMNAEIVERLQRSFEAEDRLGGPRLVELIETIASVMKKAGEHAAFLADPSKLHKNGEWLFQPYACDQALKAADLIFEHARPKGEIVEPSYEILAFGEMWVADHGPKGLTGEFTSEQRRMVKTLGRLFADDELKKKEQTDD